ncbi:MAG: mechanosensitive ion channel [Candidatus Cloacimonetes bacterium]|nr:mechanosensitive ion channel [Candidatus Cloacimonadota bacterium]
MKRFRLLLFISLLLALCTCLDAGNIFEHVEQDSLLLKSPVVYKDKVVFNIYSGLGGFSALERSAVVSRRLEELSEYKYLYRDSLQIYSEDGEYTIHYADKAIHTVGKADSLVLQKPLAEIAQGYHDIIADEFIPLFTHLNVRQGIILTIKTVFLVLLVLGINIFIFRMISKFISYLQSLIRSVKEKNAKGFTFKGIRILTVEQFCRAMKTLIALLRFILIALLLYFTLYFLLLAIPGTRSIARQLQAYIMTPLLGVSEAVLNYLPSLFFIIMVVIVTRYVLKFLRYIFYEIRHGRIRFATFYPEWANSTYQIVKFLIIFFTLVIIFPYLPGSSSPAFQGISIFVGVLVSLGSSSAIANIIAGIILTYMRPYQIGDFVRIGDKQGVLLEATLLVVRVKTVKNEEINIPNAIVLADNITNYSSYAREKRLILHTKVNIRYDVPWRKASELLVSAALKSHGINTNKPPFVNITELLDHYVEYELNAYTDNPKAMPMIYAELHKNILDSFAEAEVEILSPMYNAIKDGNMSTIPRDS